MWPHNLYLVSEVVCCAGRHSVPALPVGQSVSRIQWLWARHVIQWLWARHVIQLLWARHVIQWLWARHVIQWLWAQHVIQLLWARHVIQLLWARHVVVVPRVTLSYVWWWWVLHCELRVVVLLQISWPKALSGRCCMGSPPTRHPIGTSWRPGAPHGAVALLDWRLFSCNPLLEDNLLYKLAPRCATWAHQLPDDAGPRA